MAYKQVDTVVLSAKKHCSFDKAARELLFIQKLGSQQRYNVLNDFEVPVESST